MINLLPLNHCTWRIGLLIHRLEELPTRTRVIFYRQPNQKKIFVEWIWLGKILANGIQFAKFAKVFPARILHYTVVGIERNIWNVAFSHL